MFLLTFACMIYLNIICIHRLRVGCLKKKFQAQNRPEDTSLNSMRCLSKKKMLPRSNDHLTVQFRTLSETMFSFLASQRQRSSNTHSPDSLPSLSSSLGQPLAAFRSLCLVSVFSFSLSYKTLIQFLIFSFFSLLIIRLQRKIKTIFLSN